MDSVQSFWRLSILAQESIPNSVAEEIPKTVVEATPWGIADWSTLFVFAAVAVAGIYHWMKYLNLPSTRKAAFLVDQSVDARWGLVDVLVIVFIWIGSQVFVLTILNSQYGYSTTNPPTGANAARFGVVIGIVQVMTMGLCMIYLLGRYKHHERDFGFSRKQLLPGIAAGLICFTMWIPIVWIVQFILVSFIEYSHPSFDRIADSRNLRTVIDTWVVAVIVAPIVEEVLFRGVIQGWLQRIRKEAYADPNALILGGEMMTPGENPGNKPKRQKKRWLHIPSIVITSVLFGLAHFSQGPAPYSLFVLSLGLGYLYQRTGSLVACIVMHMCLNLITMVLFTLGTFAG